MPKENTALETQETAKAEDAPMGAGTAENQSADGSRTYTQEEFEAALEAAVKERTAGAVRERVDRANRQRKELETANKGLEEQIASIASELAQYKHKEQMRELAHKVSEETGVPESVLRGSTEEEMMAHAEALKAYMEKPSAPYVGSDGFASEQKQTQSVEDKFGALIDEMLS